MESVAMRVNNDLFKIQAKQHIFEKFVNDIGSDNIERIYRGKKGGFFIMMKGHEHHEDELKCAKILADNGLMIRLFPEGARYSDFVSSSGKYREGKINNNWYEQSTPKHYTERAVMDKIGHAQEKTAHTAIIYDKSGDFRQDDIKRSIARFKGVHKNRTIYVKRLIIVYGDTKEIKSVKI